MAKQTLKERYQKNKEKFQAYSKARYWETKETRREARKTSHQRYKERMKKYELERWNETRKKQMDTAVAQKEKLVLEYKMAHPCPCGEADPEVLCFHHLDPTTKIKNVSEMTQRGGIEALKAEIAKCEILCANCHIRRHNKLRAKQTA